MVGKGGSSFFQLFPQLCRFLGAAAVPVPRVDKDASRYHDVEGGEQEPEANDPNFSGNAPEPKDHGVRSDEDEKRRQLSHGQRSGDRQNLLSRRVPGDFRFEGSDFGN